MHLCVPMCRRVCGPMPAMLPTSYISGEPCKTSQRISPLFSCSVANSSNPVSDHVVEGQDVLYRVVDLATQHNMLI